MPRSFLSSLPLPPPLRRLVPRRWSGDSQNSVAEFMEYRTRLVSPLMRRILLVNTLPLGLLALTLLYLTQFQNSLLEAEVSALREQARIYAGALGHSAMATARHETVLEPALARPLLLRLTEPSPSAHARLFAPDGQVVADSRADQPVPPGAPVRATPLSSAEEEDHSSPLHPPSINMGERLYNWLLAQLPTLSGERIMMLDTPDSDPSIQPVTQPDGTRVMEIPPYIRRNANHQLMVTVAEPVMDDAQTTVGIIQLTREARDVDRSLFAVRSSILSLFLMALALTILLSWYLSLTIARPLLRLAASAHIMRESSGRTDMVPERLLARGDEIGEVARALQDSASALWARMDAIERFAADVSHEIKNPLSSIRSAIESLLRIDDPARQRRLMSIINDDVRRLDRLITDIADASRVDAELSRTRTEPVAIVPLLSVLTEIHQATRQPGQPYMVVASSGDSPERRLTVLAVEDRLVQVLRNLIGNAISFSPPDGKILLSAVPAGNMVEIAVSDDGPGIPQAKLDNIFDRFYSERPSSENFGQHSGLGLSISKQIITALRGTISAENRTDADGHVQGARFVICLPRVEPKPEVSRPHP
ncbi:Sensor protein ChvG [Gluconacetobacter sp. SXCC-1]|uniref:histidine kinase n=2 Tax=Komagataeibacter rhaeticus TaxID=215221 RepID=A0A181C6D9_9PROT|nr:histidine kinase [Komagataeibacter xylinus]EGG77856.1 Sensor protein ChvG [Gluconacetobacter sp. SXCC-1]KDU97547.1 histidine kinase [Komagataeibacter rhaeticus AF1]MBL7240819.1 sensor N-terminal transmembrane domain-containing protein [Komagataeibacter rhaeticus]QIP34110.1 HAMP domain-containing protein [Komagataeibacter rhaeticus]